MSTSDTTARAGEWQCTPAEYHADKSRVGRSMLADLRKDPAYFYARHVAQTMPQFEPTKSMRIGTLTDILLLQPSQWDLIVTEPIVNKRTNEGKAILAAFYEESAGKIVADPDELETAKRCAAAVLSHPLAAEALALEGPTQQAIWWIDDDTEIACKALRDKATPGIVIDLKTSADPSPEAFSRSCVTYGYHCQAAWYSDGHTFLTGERPEFLFIVVGNEPPHSVALYELDQSAIELGRATNQAALELLAECRRTNNWSPRFSRQVNTLSLPRWAAYQSEWEL